MNPVNQIFSFLSKIPICCRIVGIAHDSQHNLRKHFNEVWLPQRAEAYFKERFPKALPFLPRILPLPATTSALVGPHA